MCVVFVRTYINTSIYYTCYMLYVFVCVDILVYKDTHCFLTFEQWPWRRCRAIETSHGRWEVDAAMSIVSHHRSVFLL